MIYINDVFHEIVMYIYYLDDLLVIVIVECVWDRLSCSDITKFG